MRTAHLRTFSLVALLSLCLGWSAWLQAEHIHIEQSPHVSDCLVCHHAAPAVLSTAPFDVPISFSALVTSQHYIQSPRVALALLPPARAPPAVFI